MIEHFVNYRKSWPPPPGTNKQAWCERANTATVRVVSLEATDPNYSWYCTKLVRNFYFCAWILTLRFFVRASRVHVRSPVLKYTGVKHRLCVDGRGRRECNSINRRSQHPFKHPTDNGAKEFIWGDIYVLAVCGSRAARRFNFSSGGCDSIRNFISPCTVISLKLINAIDMIGAT